MDHLIPSIQSFCTLWSDSETSFNSHSATSRMVWHPLVVFDCIATWTSNRSTECTCVWLGVLLQMAMEELESDPLEFLICPLPICRLSPPKYSNYNVDGFFVPSAPRFQSSDFTSSEYTICFLDETFCSVVSHSKPNPELASGIHSVHWICGALFHQHFLTNWDKFLCLLLAMQSFTWRLPVTTVLTSGQDASSVFHQPRKDKRFVAEWLLRAALNVRLDGSDGIIAFSMSPFDSWCVLVVTSA